MLSDIEMNDSGNISLEQIQILNNNNYKFDCGKYLGILCISLVIFTFPVVQICYGAIYENSVDGCDSFLSISTWLITSGCVGIFVGILILLMLIDMHNESKILCINIIVYLASFFQLIWIICGSIMFWKDCSKAVPNSVNILMWISLIAGYFAIYQQLKSKK